MEEAFVKSSKLVLTGAHACNCGNEDFTVTEGQSFPSPNGPNSKAPTSTLSSSTDKLPKEDSCSC